MPTVIFIEKECSICRHTGRYVNTGLQNIGKPQDLDGRYGGALRSSIYMLMQRCPHCGYCAFDITTGNARIAEIITQPHYVEQLKDKSYPDAANTFLCNAFIHRELELYNEAGTAALYAAWVCDDNHDYFTQALTCRQLAKSYFIQARMNKQQFCDSTEEEICLLADIMRRSKLFEEARDFIKNEKVKVVSEIGKIVIKLQEEYINHKDYRTHTLQEVKAKRDDFGGA